MEGLVRIDPPTLKRAASGAEEVRASKLGRALLIKGNPHCVHYMVITGEGRNAVGQCRNCGRKIAYGLINLEKYGRRLQYERTTPLSYDKLIEKVKLGS